MNAISFPGLEWFNDLVFSPRAFRAGAGSSGNVGAGTQRVPDIILADALLLEPSRLR